MLNSRLSGKTILVVGAAGNLGPFWVKEIMGQGASVLGLGLGVADDPSLGKLRKEFPDSLHLVEIDITTEFSLDTVFGELGLEAEHRSVDGVVMNAGIDSVPGTGRASLADYDRQEWERIFRVNVIGVIGALNTLLPVLSSPSSVVMLGSLYGMVSPKPAMYSHFHDGKGSLKHPAYGASKAALVAAARQYGTHLAPHGVRVNTLTLGGVAAGQDAEFVTKFVNHVPQEKMLSIDEITGAMIFLLSDDSVAMTGQNVVVDGGYTAW